MIELTVLVFRLLLCVVFLLSGSTKLVDLGGLRDALRDFGLPAPLRRFVSLGLPPVELGVSVLLIPASLFVYGAYGALALLSIFLIAAGVAMLQGRKANCNCFGQIHSTPVGWSLLIRNGVLAACAAWVALKGREYPGPDVWLWLLALEGGERRTAIIAGCVLALGFFYLLDRVRSRNEYAESASSSDSDDAVGRDDDRDSEPVSLKRRAPREQPSEPALPAVMGIGLPVGTSAPEFELADLSGKKHSLRTLLQQGRSVLIIFSSPHCPSCVALMSNLVRWTQETEKLPSVVIISSGTVEDNSAKGNGFRPILIQHNFEISAAYDSDTTPTGVLVGADGRILSDLAVGGAAIQQLLQTSADFR